MWALHTDREIPNRSAQPPGGFVWSRHCDVIRVAAASPVVIAAGGDLDLERLRLSGDAVDEAVVARDAPGPPALQVMFEGLGLAEALERVALDVADEVVDS